MQLQKKLDEDALEAQRLARKYFVIGLDFSLPGLAELDGVIDDVDVYMDGGANEENVRLLTRTWGAYLGETLRRNEIGEWIESDNEFGALLQVGDRQVSPHARIRKRLTEGNSHNLAAFAKELSAPNA